VASSRTPLILVVDDEEGVRALLTRYLEMEGFEVQEAPDGDTALSMIKERLPDLVLLDVIMPSSDGLDVLTHLRRTSDVPIILLTGRDASADRVMGLKLGADDYVVKPFSPAEVAARISTVLRRARSAAPAPAPKLEFEGLSIDLATREVRVNGEIVSTTAKEFDLLVFLASSPRQVFSREQLLEHVWQSSSAWQNPDTVTEHVRRLRRRIEADPEHPRRILTVWSVGYRFEP
jgi:two-component system, OmpR family, phosphate regulon response regulator PhoB